MQNLAQHSKALVEEYFGESAELAKIDIGKRSL